jgi:hypothetical protein
MSRLVALVIFHLRDDLSANLHKLNENKAFFRQKSIKHNEINAFFVKLFVYLAENE